MADKSSEPRLDLVDTAVRFLENSKVQGTSQELKQSFLLKKGLTEQEISLALGRVQSTAPVNHPVQSINYSPQTRFSDSLRDVVNILVLIGGFSYGLRYLWKKYIRGWLFGENPEPSVETTLLKTNQTLLNTILGLQQNIIKIQELLESFGNEQKTDVALNQVSKEIISLKGLILSSRSFPEQPRISSPSIPSWQLLSPPKEETTPELKPDIQELSLRSEPSETERSIWENKDGGDAGQDGSRTLENKDGGAAAGQDGSSTWENKDGGVVGHDGSSTWENKDGGAAAGQDGSSASEIEMLSAGSSSSEEAPGMDADRMAAHNNFQEKVEDLD